MIETLEQFFECPDDTIFTSDEVHSLLYYGKSEIANVIMRDLNKDPSFHIPNHSFKDKIFFDDDNGFTCTKEAIYLLAMYGYEWSNRCKEFFKYSTINHQPYMYGDFLLRRATIAMKDSK